MWRRLFPQRASEADLEEEFAAHLAIETRQLIERGMTREQAEMEARRLFGSRALIAETRSRRARLRRIRPTLAGRPLRRPHFAPRTRIYGGRGAVARARNRRDHHGLQHRRHRLPAPAPVCRCRAISVAGGAFLQHRRRISPFAGLRRVAPRYPHVPVARRHTGDFGTNMVLRHIQPGRGAGRTSFGQLPRCLCRHACLGPLLPG